jgi:hypothetical protein
MFRAKRCGRVVDKVVGQRRKAEKVADRKKVVCPGA